MPKNQVKYIINWKENEIDTFVIFYNSFGEADKKRLLLSKTEGKIFKVVIFTKEGNRTYGKTIKR